MSPGSLEGKKATVADGWTLSTCGAERSVRSKVVASYTNVSRQAPDHLIHNNLINNGEISFMVPVNRGSEPLLGRRCKKEMR